MRHCGQCCTLNCGKTVLLHSYCVCMRVNVLCAASVRGAGTAAINMCLVASGCVEAYYEIGMHVWDLAAGSLIVSEAGGVLLDVEGSDRWTAAAPTERHQGVEPHHLCVPLQVDRLI